MSRPFLCARHPHPLVAAPETATRLVRAHAFLGRWPTGRNRWPTRPRGAQRAGRASSARATSRATSTGCAKVSVPTVTSAPSWSSIIRFAMHQSGCRHPLLDREVARPTVGELLDRAARRAERAEVSALETLASARTERLGQLEVRTGA